MLDLTLVSEDMAGKSLWEVLKESTIGSDYYPIYCNTGIEVEKTEKKKDYIPSWKLRNVDWKNFKIECSNIIIKLIQLSELDVEVEEYNSIMFSATCA